MTDDDLFRRLEQEIGELPPGTDVEYHGRMLGCHGLWVVHSQVDDYRYTLTSVDGYPFVRLNANREELTKLLPDT